jgi:hypothetical protein
MSKIVVFFIKHLPCVIDLKLYTPKSRPNLFFSLLMTRFNRAESIDRTYYRKS